MRPAAGLPGGAAAAALVGRFQRARTDPSKALLEGFHPLKHALRFGAAVEVACAPDLLVLQRLAEQLAPDVWPALTAMTMPVAPALFEQLAPVAPTTGVIAIATRPADGAAALPDGTSTAEGPVILLDSPTHLGNVGAVIRVAAAAGAAAVLTVGGPDPWHPVALRGSAGLHFALRVGRIDRLPGCGRPVIAIDPGGETMMPGTVPVGAILAFGSERRGLGEAILARAERRLAIPMRPGVSSLNLATAVAVVLYACGPLAMPPGR